MYKLCKTEQSARRQRELEQGLLNAMCTHRYEEISVSDLCDQMGVPRKSFYRYFDGKDGAMQSLLYHNITDFHSFSMFIEKKDKRTLQGEFEEFFLFSRE